MEDVTDNSSKGLLPQLVEVLQALACSQELLKDRVRSVRLARTVVDNPFLDASATAGRLEDGRTTAQRTAGFATITAGTGERRGPDATGGAERTEPHSPEVNLAFSTEGTKSRGHTGRIHEEFAPPDPSREPPAANERHPLPAKTKSRRVDTYEETDRVASDTDRENRNYNFFDDLDAKLAGMNGSDAVTDQEGSDPGGSDPEQH